MTSLVESKMTIYDFKGSIKEDSPHKKKHKIILMCVAHRCEREHVFPYLDHVLSNFKVELLPPFWKVGSFGHIALIPSEIIKDVAQQ
jgi:hypothetical protein